MICTSWYVQLMLMRRMVTFISQRFRWTAIFASRPEISMLLIVLQIIFSFCKHHGQLIMKIRLIYKTSFNLAIQGYLIHCNIPLKTPSTYDFVQFLSHFLLFCSIWPSAEVNHKRFGLIWIILDPNHPHIVFIVKSGWIIDKRSVKISEWRSATPVLYLRVCLYE